MNTIRELHAAAPKELYVVAALVDLRTNADRARFDALAAELGTRIRTVSLAQGSVELPADVLDRARRHLAALPDAAGPDADLPGGADPGTTGPGTMSLRTADPGAAGPGTVELLPVDPAASSGAPGAPAGPI